jgi:hypothetical protein
MSEPQQQPVFELELINFEGQLVNHEEEFTDKPESQTKKRRKKLSGKSKGKWTENVNETMRIGWMQST